MRKRLFISLLILVCLFAAPAGALAQSYSFSLDQEIVDVYWNEDGTASIDYVFVFSNDPGAHPIDFVDVGLPNSSFEVSSISADVNGQPLDFISRSEYQGNGSGVAVGLDEYAIQPGQSGRVHVFVGTQRNVLHPDTEGDDYASAVFSPTWFGSEFVQGNTDMTVRFHLPPGVQPDEPRWHEAPEGWASQPETGLDEQGRVTYTWRNSMARADEQYTFGASFPASYVPASAIQRPSFLETLGISMDDLIGFGFCCGFAVFTFAMVFGAMRSAQKRKMQYLPPKVAIEGHGIKRGLTAIESAILLEQPMDKILTMILFAVVKKGAATVKTRNPLEIIPTEPLPEGLRPYEEEFLKAFLKENKAARRKGLQAAMVDLVKEVAAKMKGFSRRETIAYYRDIVDRAWKQVEAADTPEVKSERYDEVMEWTMLDKNYEDRTREVFRTGPVFVPMWWGRYDPGWGRSTTTTSIPTAGGSSGGGVSLPNLPGSAFAASVVTGVQDFSANVVGSLSDFTGGVTDRTNPVPVSTSSGRSSGGGGCACACACAGCACACAGGGR